MGVLSTYFKHVFLYSLLNKELSPLQGEDTPLGLGLIFDEGVFLSYANHHTLVTRMTHNEWEDKNVKQNWETKYITTMQEEL